MNNFMRSKNYTNRHFICLKLWIYYEKYFPVWLQNRLISARLESVLTNTEKLCIASYYRQVSTNIKIKS